MGDLGQLLAKIIDIGAQLWIVVDSELLNYLGIRLPAELDFFPIIQEHQFSLTGYRIYSARHQKRN